MVTRSARGRSETHERLFSKPDLFIFDAIAREVYLAEIKFRRRDSSREVGLRLQDLKKALKYWSDATLVVTIPVERVFYAQKLKELEDIIVRTDSGPLIDFNLERQFVPIESLFARIRPQALNKYRSIIRGL